MNHQKNIPGPYLEPLADHQKRSSHRVLRLKSQKFVDFNCIKVLQAPLEGALFLFGEPLVVNDDTVADGRHVQFFADGANSLFIRDITRLASTVVHFRQMQQLVLGFKKKKKI